MVNLVTVCGVSDSVKMCATWARFVACEAFKSFGGFSGLFGRLGNECICTPSLSLNGLANDLTIRF